MTQYATEQLEEFKMKNRKNIRSRIIFAIVLIPTLATVLAVSERLPIKWSFPIVLVFIVSLIIVATNFARSFKCPACKKKPGRHIFVKKCVECGLELR